MKLRTHIAFGLLFGSLLNYFLEFGFGFIMLTGFAGFLPDIDWAMQFKWGMGNRHRTFGHNIWFILAVSLIGFIASRSYILLLGLLLGMLSHLIADSLTVSGVYWLYPYGKDENKFQTKGPFSMYDENNREREKIIGTVVLTLAGFLFFIKEMEFVLLSVEGVITLGVVAFIGYVLMNKIDEVIKKLIRELGL